MVQMEELAVSDDGDEYEGGYDFDEYYDDEGNFTGF